MHATDGRGRLQQIQYDADVHFTIENVRNQVRAEINRVRQQNEQHFQANLFEYCVEFGSTSEIRTNRTGNIVEFAYHLDQRTFVDKELQIDCDTRRDFNEQIEIGQQ